MAGNVFPADAVSGSPSYTGTMGRTTLGTLLSKNTTRPLGARSGINPASNASTVTASSSTWTVTPFSGVLDTEASGTNGAYFFSFDANVTGSVTAADPTNPRIDLLSVQLSDPAAGDGTSAPGVAIVYTAGTAAATPAVPATPARALALAQITVPQSGGGSPSVAVVAPFMGAAGGIVPCRTSAEYPAAPYVGQYVDDATLGLIRWNGSVWIPQTTVYTYTGSPLAGSTFAASLPVRVFEGRKNVTSDTNALVTQAISCTSLLETNAWPEGSGGALQHLRTRYDLCTTSLAVWQLYNAAGSLAPSTGIIFSFRVDMQ